MSTITETKTWPQILEQDVFSHEDTERAGEWETCALGELGNLRENTELGKYASISDWRIIVYFGETIHKLGGDFYNALIRDDAEKARNIYAELKSKVEEKLAEKAKKEAAQ